MGRRGIWKGSVLVVVVVVAASGSDSDAASEEDCMDPLTFSSDVGFTDAWVLIDGRVSARGPSELPGDTAIDLPPDAALLEPDEVAGGEWAEVRRSADLSGVLPVATIDEGIDAINAAPGPVLIGLGHFVSWDVRATTTTFDVGPDGQLVRQLACSEQLRVEVEDYWRAARRRLPRLATRVHGDRHRRDRRAVPRTGRHAGRRLTPLARTPNAGPSGGPAATIRRPTRAVGADPHRR
jgi:hypothetical protein